MVFGVFFENLRCLRLLYCGWNSDRTMVCWILRSSRTRVRNPADIRSIFHWNV